MHDILIVDDEADIREMIAGVLEDEGLEARGAANSDEAFAQLRRRAPSLLILDIWLRDSALDGVGILRRVHEEYPDLPVVMISGHGNIELAVETMKEGAYDFIEKPFQIDHLMVVVNRALETGRMRAELRDLRSRGAGDPVLIGESAALRQLRAQIGKIAPTNSRILITGPSGAGKEVAARMIHAESRRANAPFVAVSCAAIAPDLMELELFGSAGGDGKPRKIGLMERAHGGTLFLDEIADMPAGTQSKILRVLVEQAFERVGGGGRVKVDMRIVSSTARDLAVEIEAGRFRADLMHRLNVVPLKIPPLTERREDVPLLVDSFMSQLAAANGMAPRAVSDEAMAALQAHSWPGNVRQLRNVVEQLLILGPDDGGREPIVVDQLPADVRGAAPTILRGDGREQMMSLPLREARELFEREYLDAQIHRFSGNISRTAAFIGMERSALHRKLKSLRLTGPDREAP